MFVWSFNEIIDLLFCQGKAFTVFLIIHELFVYVYLIADIRYLSHSNLPVHVSLLSLKLNIILCNSNSV